MLVGVAAAVDACLPVIEAALQLGAQLLLVHHGLFWSGVQMIAGGVFRKLKLAMDHDLAIYSAHRSLDVRPPSSSSKLGGFPRASSPCNTIHALSSASADATLGFDSDQTCERSAELALQRTVFCDTMIQVMKARTKIPPTQEMKRAPLVYCVSHCLLFTGLPREDIDTVAELGIVRNLGKGDYVFRQGDPCHGFYLVQRGSINLHRVVADGREKVIHIFRENESFAEGAMSMPGGYPADARAEEPTQLLMFGKAEFLGLLRQRPDLSLCMMGSLAAHNRLLLSKLEDLTSKDVESRLADWLLKRCQKPCADAPAEVRLTVTKRVLAAELGTAAETLSRALAHLRQLGLLDANGRQLVVPNLRELERFLQARITSYR